MTETVANETVETAAEAVAEETKAPKEFKSNPGPIHESLARYVSEHSGIEVSAEQAQALLVLHKNWQSSPERKAEREQEKLLKAEEAAKRKAEAEEKKAAAKAERERKAAEKKAKEAAKKAAAEDNDSDLDDLDADDLDAAADVDDLDDLDAPAEAPKRRRGGKAGQSAAQF